MTRETFQLHRPIDGLVYTFALKGGVGREAIYERSDGVVRVVHDPRFGWCIMNPDDGSLAGRVWDVLPLDQGEYPTEGVWVGRKGPKSYVYELSYL